MPQWLSEWLVRWFLATVTKEKLEEWADALKGKVLPWLRDLKNRLVAWARAEAKKTETKIDDAGVDALDEFLDALLPDNPKTL